MIKFLIAISLVSLMTPGFFTVSATVETAPSPYPGDSVDDIAVWRHPDDPGRSLIIATLKASNQMPRQPTGLLVYDLAGNQLQFLPGGTPNNVDIRYGFLWRGKRGAIIAASHWWSGDVRLYIVNPETLRLEEITRQAIPSGLEELRGLCLYKDETNNTFHYMVINKEGGVEQYQVLTEPELTARLVRSFSLASIGEGCVADDEHHVFYVAEETVGIWRYDANPESTSRTRVARTRWRGPLKADIEGLTIYDEGDGNGFLIASSQGNDLFAVFDRRDNRYVGSFRIVDGGKVDGTTETDGIDVHSRPLGPAFPAGVFIAHDHHNTAAGESNYQNFKLVDWRNIADHLHELKQDVR